MALSQEELARRIVAARELRGMDQREIGELMEAEGYGKHDIARIERLNPNAPTFHSGRRTSLARILSVPEDWFTAEDGELFERDAAADSIAQIDERLTQINERLDQLVTWSKQGPTRKELSDRIEALTELIAPVVGAQESRLSQQPSESQPQVAPRNTRATSGRAGTGRGGRGAR